MQVKVNTGEKVYRFNQKGQLIDTITEPYVLVDARTREDIEALYDSLHEHIATAFTYEGNSISGLAAEHVNAVQNFLLVEGAWYLNDLEDPSTDLEIKNEKEGDGTPQDKATSAVAPTAETPAEADAEPQLSGFVPDANQRTLLKELQETAEKLRRITPEPGEKWNAQLQRQINSMYYFGVDDVAQACAAAETKIQQLKQAAKASGVPENVIELNTTPVNIAEIEDGTEEE
jgi:hypothetical protein